MFFSFFTLLGYFAILPTMELKRKNRLKERANILKALAHPTRLLIVEELSKEEKCVSELTKMIGSDTSTVSKHLSVLKNVGIITDDKRGLQVYYRMNVCCVMDFLNCAGKVINENTKKRKRRFFSFNTW
jgi:ArsR family transcriptional regulator